MSLCLYCNGEIPVKRKRDNGKIFCGRKCVAKYYGKIKKFPETKCLVCNKIISSVSGRKFCSNNCRGISSRSKYFKNCIYCGKEFLLNNKAYERRGGGKYCSKNCSIQSNKKYFANYDFFEKIDNEIKAYWLGFIMADGYNSNYELVIRLHGSESHHLQIFLKDIDGNQPIRVFYEYDKAKNKYYFRSSLNISSKKCVLIYLCLDVLKQKV